LSSQEPFRTRRKELLKLLQEESVLVSDPIHVYYLTGLKAALEPQFDSGVGRNPMFLRLSRNGAMFLLAGRSSLANPFVTDELAFDSKNLFEGNLWTYGDYDLKERVVAQMDFVAEELSEVMAEMKSKTGFALGTLGIEEWHVPYEVPARLLREFPSLRISGVSAAIRKEREVKSQEEVESISEGVQRLRSVLEMESILVEGETETEALERLANALKERFGPEVALRGQLLSGSRTSEVFGRPTQKKLRDEEPVILDLQTSVGGYWAREVKTARVGRGLELNDEFRRRAEDALVLAQEELRPGAEAGEIYKVVSDGLLPGDGMSLIHEAGHGIGLEPREDPFLTPNSNQVIQAGMVCVVTAGAYSDSAGARTSATLAVGKTGSTRL